MIKPCYGYYGSDSPYTSEDGAEIIKTKSIEKAKAALKEAGYAGEKVVILAVMENPILAAMCQVAEDLMRRHGDERATGCDGLRHHGAAADQQEPTDKGGWSLFVTSWTGADIANPAVHQMLRAGGPTAWFGWPDDPEMEALARQVGDGADARGAEEARDRAAGPGLQDAALHPARLADLAGRLSQEP